MPSILQHVLAAGIWPAVPLTGAFALHATGAVSRDAGLSRSARWSLTVAAGVAIWSVPLLGLAMAGHYDGPLLGAVAWLVALGFLARRPRRWGSRSSVRQAFRNVPALGLVTGLAVSGAAYLTYPSETIVGGMDQGTYANHAIYIARAGQLGVPYPWQREGQDRFARDLAPTPGIFLTEPSRTVQFSHLYQVWLAQTYSSFGLGGLFRFNGVAALLGVLAFHGLARAFLPSGLAAAAAVFLAVGPAQIWVARATLVEIPAQFFLWCGLLSIATRSRRHPAASAWAGVWFGLSMLLHIDLLVLWPLLLLSHVAANVLEPAQETGPAWRALYVGLAITSGLSLAYYHVLSQPYFLSFSSELWLLAIVTYICLMALTGLRPAVLARLGAHLNPRLALALLGSGLLAALAYDTWAPGLGLSPGLHDAPMADTALDSLLELSEYLSPVALWLGLLGWLVTWRRTRDGRVPVSASILLVVGLGLVGLYVWNPGTDTPHIWAIRRAVPAVIPFATLFGAMGIGWLLEELRPRGRAVVTAAAALYAVSFLAAADGPILAGAENQGAARQLQELAARIPADGLVLAAASPSSPLWTTPLDLAFGRRIASIDMDGPDSARTARDLLSEKGREPEPLYILAPETLRFPGLRAELLETFELSWPTTAPVRRPPAAHTLQQQIHLSLYRIDGLRSSPSFSGVDLLSTWDWRIRRGGFHPQEPEAEGSARWTTGHAWIEIAPDVLPDTGALEVRLAGTRGPDSRLEVAIDGQRVFGDALPEGPWSWEVQLPGRVSSDPLRVELTSPAWVPATLDPRSSDTRTLGVQLRSLSLVPSIRDSGRVPG